MLPSYWKLPQWLLEEFEEEERQFEAERQEELRRKQEEEAHYARVLKWQQEVEESDRLFLETSGRIRFGPKYRVTSRAFYEKYSDWCYEKGYPPKSMRDVCIYLTKHSSQYNIRSSTNIPVRKGKRLRGFIGMGIRVPEMDTDTL